MGGLGRPDLCSRIHLELSEEKSHRGESAPRQEGSDLKDAEISGGASVKALTLP